jgi:Tfp pilus assembly major pilin PilA
MSAEQPTYQPEILTGEKPVKREVPVSATQFAERAEDVFTGLNYLRDQGKSPREAYAELMQQYIEEEDVADLAHFSEVLIGFPGHIEMQRQATDLANQAQRADRNSDAYRQYRDTVATLVTYNQNLRDLIDNNPHGFSRNQMSEWLEKSGGGNTEAAGQILSGISAEVAVARELPSVEGVQSVRYATAAEDAAGTDIVVTLHDGSTRGIDVKHGEDAYMAGLDSRRSDKVIFGVHPEYLAGFQFDRDSRGWVQRTLAHALGTAR